MRGYWSFFSTNLIPRSLACRGWLLWLRNRGFLLRSTKPSPENSIIYPCRINEQPNKLISFVLNYFVLTITSAITCKIQWPLLFAPVCKPVPLEIILAPARCLFSVRREFPVWRCWGFPAPAALLRLKSVQSSLPNSAGWPPPPQLYHCIGIVLSYCVTGGLAYLPSKIVLSQII
jgi:hypothetical protein